MTLREVKVSLRRMGLLGEGEFRFFCAGVDISDDAHIGDTKTVSNVLWIKEDSIYSRFHDQMFHWDLKDKSRYGKPRHHGVLPLKSEKVLRWRVTFSIFH